MQKTAGQQRGYEGMNLPSSLNGGPGGRCLLFGLIGLGLRVRKVFEELATHGCRAEGAADATRLRDRR